MVNVLSLVSPEGIGFAALPGVSLYVNVLFTGEPEKLNACCIGNVISPGFAANTLWVNKLIRETRISDIESTTLTIRFLYCGFIPFGIPALLMLSISLTCLTTVSC